MTNAAAGKHSRAMLLWQIMTAGQVTRQQLAALTGYSKAQTAKLVSELLAAGLIVEGGECAAAARGVGPGRKSVLLSAPDTLGHVVGVSLGLRGCQAVVLGLHGREVRRCEVVQEEYPTRFASASELVAWLGGFVRQLSGALVGHGELLRVGVAVPGAVRDGAALSVLPAPLDVLRGVDVAALAAAELGVSVECGSDAEMALAGAAQLGLVDAESSAVLFTMSTVLTVATRTEQGLVAPRTAALGDFSLLAGMFHVQHLSVTGLLGLAADAGIAVERQAELWDTSNSRLGFLWDGFTAAVADAVVVAAVTSDPVTVVLTGRLAPLAELLLPKIRECIAQRLPHPPELLVVAKDSGWMVALGAAQIAVKFERDRLLAEQLA